MAEILKWTVDTTKWHGDAAVQNIKDIVTDLETLNREKADAAPIWKRVEEKADQSELNRVADAIAARLTAEHEAATRRFSQLRTQLTELHTHLQSALPDELNRLFEHHLAAIDKTSDAILVEMRSVAKQAGEHLSRVQLAEQAAVATGRNCEAIHEELITLAARLREAVSRAESDVANQVATTRAVAEGAKASAQMASQLLQQHRQATATFWSRLHWLFCGPAMQPDVRS